MNSVRLLTISMLAIMFFPVYNFAESDSEVQELKNVVLKLSEIVAEQEKRLNNLEILLNVKNMSPSQSFKPNKKLLGNQGKALIPMWHDPSSWKKIRYGMTQQQVLPILGKPTSVEKIGNQVKYVYEGVVKGSGFVKGSVLFFDNRVLIGAGVEQPTFLSK